MPRQAEWAQERRGPGREEEGILRGVWGSTTINLDSAHIAAGIS